MLAKDSLATKTKPKDKKYKNCTLWIMVDCGTTMQVECPTILIPRITNNNAQQSSTTYMHIENGDSMSRYMYVRYDF